MIMPKDINGNLASRPSELIRITDIFLSYDFDRAFNYKLTAERDKDKKRRESLKKSSNPFFQQFA